MIQLVHRPNIIQRTIKRLVGLAPIAWVLARTLHRLDQVVYDASQGRHTLSSLLTGLPVVVLTTTGARSGQPRSVPLVPLLDGDRVVLIASDFGAPKHPAWYHNLRAHPQATVAYQGQAASYIAREAEGQEREQLWSRVVDQLGAFGAYEKRARPRRIPVIVLSPTKPAQEQESET